MNNKLAQKETEEIQRLKTVLSYNMMDTPYEEEFDSLAKLVSLICETPIAVISLIDDERQWFKAKVGIEGTEAPIEETFCRYTILQDEILEIQDAQLDERVKNYPQVQASSGIRFYAGAPLKAGNGDNIGTVCVVDSQPRKLTDKQRDALQLLTKQAMMLLETRKKNRELGVELEQIVESKIKEAERQLLQKNAEYNLLLKAIKKSSGVVEFSPEGKIVSVNKNFLDSVGYQKEELLEKDHKVLFHQKDLEKLEEFWKTLRQGKFISGRFRRKHKDGRDIWLQATYNPIVDLENNIIRIINVTQDISAEIEAEKKLQQAKEMAEALNLQKDMFIANVSHEIRTPIHAVLGFTELLLEKEEDSQKKTYLQSVKTAGDNLLYIINDILDLSKIEAGIIQIEKEHFILREVVENVFNVLHLKAHQKKLRFVHRIAAEVPGSFIGDKNRLAQILINLLGNALKFTLTGSVELEVDLRSRVGENAILEFKIKDTGIGIPREKLTTIFERFSQADENTSRKFGGTGLGLNISKHLIEKQNGSISVSSTEGTGSVFSFTLPLLVDHKIHAPINENLEPVLSGAKTGRILLCEDNELNQRLIRAILSEKGLTVDLAENGTKGIELFKRNSYDLVLMDIQMPEKDGYQATKILREEIGTEIPIIALTANFMLREKEKALRCGMNDYLSKPFTKEDLIQKTFNWLDSGNENDLRETNYVGSELNLQNLEELTCGDEDFQKEMILLFINQSEIMMEEMQDHFKNKNITELKATAHKMKTSFGIIGADCHYLEEMEVHGGSTNLSGRTIFLLESIERQLKEIIYKLQNHINIPQS